MAQAILPLEILLVAAGTIFLILEFKAPGHSVCGAAAAVCWPRWTWPTWWASRRAASRRMRGG